MKKCEHSGCTHAAKVMPKLCIPAQDHPIDTHQPIGLVFGLELCQSCMDALIPSHFMTDDIRRIIEMAAHGKQPPDFARAFLTRISIASREAQMWKKNVHNKQEGKA